MPADGARADIQAIVFRRLPPRWKESRTEAIQSTNNVSRLQPGKKMSRDQLYQISYEGEIAAFIPGIGDGAVLRCLPRIVADGALELLEQLLRRDVALVGFAQRLEKVVAENRMPLEAAIGDRFGAAGRDGLTGHFSIDFAKEAIRPLQLAAKQ